MTMTETATDTDFVKTSAPATDPVASASPFAWVDRGRIPCLDGFRGVSILMVLACHCGYAYRDRLAPVAHTLLVRAAIGVDVFFVISGFLITLLLLREQSTTGRVNLKAFYVRRGFRILPAYLCFAACIPLFVRFHAGITPLTTRDWLAIPTFFVDFLLDRPLGIAHLWSLSVEEHFYLIYPALLWRNRRCAVWLTASWVAITPVYRYAALHAPVILPDAKFWTFTRADAIAIGCLLAFAVRSPRWRQRLLWDGRWATLLAAAAMAVLLISPFMPIRRWSILYLNLFGGTVDAVCIAVVVWACILHADAPAIRVLEARPLVAMGLLSYSIYLWQQPLTVDASVGPFLTRLLTLAALAVGSYWLVEQPFLRLKARRARATRRRVVVAVGQPVATADAADRT